MSKLSSNQAPGDHQPKAQAPALFTQQRATNARLKPIAGLQESGLTSAHRKLICEIESLLPEQSHEAWDEALDDAINGCFGFEGCLHRLIGFLHGVQASGVMAYEDFCDADTKVRQLMGGEV